MLVHFDEARLYAVAVTAFFGALTIASATVNHLSENETVDNLTLVGGVITSTLSVLSTIGSVKVNRDGKIITEEIQNRGLEVPRGLIRRIRN